MIYWIVDTAGGDWPEYAAVYSNLETAQADAYDLVTAQESLTIECTDSSGTGAFPDTTAVIVDGWTTSTDYTLTIKAHENDEHGGVWDDSKYKLSLGDSFPPGGLSINISCICSNIQLEGADQYLGLVHINSVTSDVVCNFLYIRKPIGNTQLNARGVYIQASNTTILNNCIADGFTDHGFYAYNDMCIISNSIAVNCTNGFYGRAVGYPDVINCIGIANTIDFVNCDTVNSDHNVSSDLTAPGTNTVHSFDHSTLFPSAASGDFRPAIPYVDALGESWGAGAIPWERDVVVDTSGTGDDLWTIASDELFVTPTLDAGWTNGDAGGFDFATTGAVSFITIPTPIVISSVYRLEAICTNYIGTGTLGFSTSGFPIGNTIASNGTIYNAGEVANGTSLRFYADTNVTTVTVNISVYEVTSGADGQIDETMIYTSLASAEAGEQAIGDDLALRNEKMVISCTSGGTTTADTTAVTLDANWLTSESCDFTVQGEADGVWDDAKYKLVTPALSLIYPSINNLNIISLQGDTNNSSGSVYGINITTQVLNLFISNLICRNSGLGLAAINLGGSSDGSTIKIANIVAYGFLSAGIMEEYSTGSVISIYNSCIVDCVAGVEVRDSIAECVNCISVANTIDYDTGLTSSYTNISSDGTAPDNATSYTVYDAATQTLPVVPEDCVIFKDIVGNDFRLVSHFVEDYTGTMVETNSAIGNGTWLYDVADDNAGKSREPYDFKGIRTARPFDIGAWQAPAQLTYVVDTDGVSGDYSNLATAFAGLQADSTDLVTDNLLPTISCQASTGVADTVSVSFSGIVTSADCPLIVESNEAHRHSYIWDATKYRLEVIPSAYHGVIDANIDFLFLNWLQIDNQNMTNGFSRSVYYEVCGVNNYQEINNCIIKNSTGAAATFECYGIEYDDPDFIGVINNSILYGHRNYAIFADYCTSVDANNCTIYGGLAQGIDRDSGAATITDSISISDNAQNDINGTWTKINTATFDLTGNITGLTSDYFTDAANGDFTPVASAGDLTSYGASANSTETVGAIPFVDEKVVDTGGTGDYANLATWESYAQGACVAGETARALCESSDGSADLGVAEMSGWSAGVACEITSQDNYVLAPNTLHDYAISLHDTIPLKISGISITPNLDRSGIKIVSGIAEITNVHIHTTERHDGYGIRVTSVDGLSGVTGCTVSGFDLSGGYGISTGDNSEAKLLVKNSTVSNCRFGVLRGVIGDVIAINCVVDSADFDDYLNCASVSSNNVSSDDTAPGTSPTINQDFTDDFVSTTDFHTTDSPYELWGADAAYAGAFGDEPYEVVRVVDTDGVSGDYPSLSAAVAYYQTNRADLVTRNEKALINCQASTGVADNNNFILENINTTKENPIRIVVPIAHRPNFAFTSGYRLVRLGTWQQALSINGCNGVELDGLGLGVTDTSSEHTLHLLNYYYVKVTNCIIKGLYDDVSPVPVVGLGFKNAELYFYNNIFYGGSNQIAFGWIYDQYIEIANNLFINFSNHGVYTPDNQTGFVRNNIAVSDLALTGDCFYLVAGVNSSNNISSDTSGDITDTALNLFVDAAGGDFRLADTATNAIGGGVDLSADFTTDITGATRTAPWDIGAFSYVLILISPSTDSLGEAQPVTFNWGPYVGASRYQLQVSEFSDFNTNIIDVSITETQYTEAILTADTLYYWRVRAEL